MKFNKTPIEGLVVIEPQIHHDDRGYFFESYNCAKLKIAGITDVFVQDNEAKSAAGVLRGLHYQVGTSGQSKLVRVIQGKVYDVAVDLRENSPTFGQWHGIYLDAESKVQFYIPRGFAHGYLALEDNTILCYKCDNRYDRDAEGGIRYDDAQLNIRWPSNGLTLQVSEKDLQLPNFGSHKAP